MHYHDNLLWKSYGIITQDCVLKQQLYPILPIFAIYAYGPVPTCEKNVDGANVDAEMLLYLFAVVP